MDTEQRVAQHYTREGLEQAILSGLEASGKDIGKLTASDLSAVDEFHLGWLPATIEFARELGLAKGMHVLDVGSGVGGPARYFVEAHGCRVTGIDLTEGFVQVANALTERCGLADRATFMRASALALPFEQGAFDAASLIHVGMNIQDKAKLFSEVRRVLKSGGRFGVYEVMEVADGELPYPMPWSQTLDTSFVERPETYRRLLTAAGFTLEKERSQRDFALSLAQAMRDKGTQPLGLQTLMGPAGQERMTNVMETLGRGIIAPIEIIARAV